MDQFDETTGVLDSSNWLNYSDLNTYIERNKEVVLDSNKLKRFASTSSLLSKKTYFIPHFSNITAGHYPVCVNTHGNPTSVNDKPLIQVTVRPQSPQTAHKIRKRPPKNTAFANLSHSISNNNIYLLVPGVPKRKKDKVYAIYTTKLNDKIIKEVNFNNLLSKCILKSNITREMNKNKKKGSDKKEKRESTSIPECSPDCAYVNLINKKKTADSDKSGSESPRSPARSKYKIVESNTSISLKHRITGKRSLKSPERSSPKNVSKTNSPIRFNRQQTKINFYQTESDEKEGNTKSPDRYSFINNTRSIESIIAETKRRSPQRYDERAPSPERLGRIRITGRLGLTKDDKCVLKCNATLDDKPIPTHFQGVTCDMQQPCTETCTEECRMESQATQVDFQVFYSKNSPSNITQKCACVNTVIVGDENGTDTDKSNKKYNNPIIVISVYPKNEIAGENTGDLKQKDNKTTVQKKDNKKIGRSRSPSPVKTTKKTGAKQSETRINASSSKKIVRESTRKETRSRERDKSPSRNIVQSTTVTKSKTETKTSKIKTPKSQKTPPQSRRSKSPQNPEETKVTEQMIKKALIEDFTKNYTEQVIQRNTRIDIPLQTKHNVSNITIDIEGDSDYYNVKFAQDAGKLNTEFTVRNPTRGKSPGEMATGENDSTSLENFLYVKPDSEPRKRSFSQTLMFDGTDLMLNNGTETEHELEVKDSIEISHRRENASRPTLHIEDERKYVPKEVDTEYLAQMKHFQGDECSVSDRHERDKEIRKLLGIDKITETDPSRFRNSKTVLIGSCSQTPCDAVVPLRLCIRDSFSGTSQTNNSSSTLNFIDNSKSRIVKCISLEQPMYQLIWNGNIQMIYRQNCHKRKSIILTRRQYVNVKKTIYNTLIKKHNTFYRVKWYNYYRRRCSSDSVTSETKNVILHYDKDSQTEESQPANIQAHAKNQVFHIRSDKYTIKEIRDCGDGTSKHREEKSKASSNSSNKTFEHSSYNAKWTQHAMQLDKYMHNVQRTVLICKMPKKPIKKCVKENSFRKTASAKEIQCQNVTVTSLKFSSSDIADYRLGANTVEINDTSSVHTIFKNRRKPVTLTPNLGSSAYSLCESSDRLKSGLKLFEDSINHNLRPKKPFLRRLMSCLVFNVFPTSHSQPQIPVSLKTHGPSSSFDSYHIGTSFGAIEMDSSLYDTTASFYSDHAIQPTTKTKRGFFGSVRVFFSRKP